MTQVDLCTDEQQNQCAYYRFGQSDFDGYDIVAAAIVYLVLWVKPETTLFPTGFAIYMIPCALGAIKFCKRSCSPIGLEYLYGTINVILSIIAVLGLFGCFSGEIINETNVIMIDKSLQSLIHVQCFPTVILLLIAGTSIVFMVVKYLVPQTHSNRVRRTQVVSPQ